MKVKFLLSSCVLLLFAILAGGSFDGDDFKILLWVVGIFFVCMMVGMFVLIVESNNKKTRLEMIEKDEAENKDFDRSVSFGNDRCRFYFDASKKQVMIMRIMTEGINKQYIDDFEFGGEELCCQRDPFFCIYDSKNRKLLSGVYKKLTPTYSVSNIAVDDKYKDIVPNSNIVPKIVSYSNPTATSNIIFTLIDESHGLMAIIRKGKISSIFNYIDRASLRQKTGSVSSVSDKAIGSYHFIMDDFSNVLVIVTPSSYELIKYSDIIDVTYEENGIQLYSKSTMRTVGGAVVGGALMGGAGAIVGGLSGDTKKTVEIKTMQIKILLRNTQRTSCVLNFKDSDYVKTSDPQYEEYQKNANQAKDLLSVIIDKVKQTTAPIVQQVVSHAPVSQSGVADELAKLAKLKADGILTDEEFNAQKAKLLNM